MSAGADLAKARLGTILEALGLDQAAQEDASAALDSGEPRPDGTVWDYGELLEEHALRVPWAANRTPAEVEETLARLGVPERVVRAVGDGLRTRGVQLVTASARLTYDRAKDVLRRVLLLPRPEHYDAVLLTAAQAHLIGLLESVVYLGFIGGTGSGKGTGVECAIALTPNGQVLSSAREAYLATVLDEGRSIGIEEADRLVRANPAIEALIRTGYRRGAVYGLKVELAEPVKAKGGTRERWTTAERSIFGFKVFDYNSAVDAHLLGRSIVIEMQPDDSVQRALAAERKRVVLEPIRRWLAAQAEAALTVWTPERVRELVESPSFRETVRGMGGRVGRDHVVAANLLIVAKVMGWPCDQAIRRLVMGRKRADDDSEEVEVAKAILRQTPTDKAFELPTRDLLVMLNEERGKAKLRPMTPQRLAGVLRDLGFSKAPRDGKDPTWYRSKASEHRDAAVIRPSPLYTQLAQLAHPAHPDMEVGAMGAMGATYGDGGLVRLQALRDLPELVGADGATFAAKRGELFNVPSETANVLIRRRAARQVANDAVWVPPPEGLA